MDDCSASNPETSEGEVSLVDILVVVLKKRRIILWTTILGLCLAVILGLGPRLAPGLFAKAPAAQMSSRLKALVFEDGLGPVAVALAKSQSFKDALAKDLGVEKVSDSALGVSFEPGTRTLTILGQGESASKATALAQGAYAQLIKMATPLGGKRYPALAQAIDAEASRLALGRRPETSQGNEEPKLKAAVAARAKRIVAEVYFRVSTSTMDPGDLAFKVQEAMVKSYVEVEKIALAELAGGELPPGALSQATAARLDYLVAVNLLAEARLYRSIPRSLEESFAIIGVEDASVPAKAPASPTKTLALGLFASLFLGLLLAFLSNAWDGIRADPAAMAKIKDALKPKS